MIHTYSLDIVDSCECGLRFGRLRATNVNHRAPSPGLFVGVNCILCLIMMRGNEWSLLPVLKVYKGKLIQLKSRM